jgi:hypothetical protein
LPPLALPDNVNLQRCGALMGPATPRDAGTQLAVLCAREVAEDAVMSMCIKMCCVLFAGITVANAVETPSAADVQRRHMAISNALKAAAPFKHDVESYRRHHDTFPANNVEAMLGPPESYMSPDVRRIAIDRNGVINITLTASSGVDGGVIVLKPNLPANTDDYAVEWKCTSANYSDVSDATLGTCEYTKVP